MAGPHTKATITRTSWTFEPPAGWTYAQLEDATLALSGNAAVAVIVYPAPEPKKEAAQRDLIAAEVIKKLAVVTKKLVWPRKPDSVAPGALKVSLYQFDGAKREDKPGALLFFTTKLPDGKALLGAGFDPEADTTKADEAIMAAVGSIAAQPDAAPPPPAAPAPAAAPAPPGAAAPPAATPTPTPAK